MSKLQVKCQHLKQLAATSFVAAALFLCVSFIPSCNSQPVAVSVQVPSLLEILNPLTWVDAVTDATNTILTPTTCDQVDCPNYEVVDRLGSTIELRSYSPAAWAATAVDDEGDSQDMATVVGTQRLLRYFSGRNDADANLAITAPVLTVVKLDEDDQPQEGVVVAFYLPRKYQAPGGNNTPRTPQAIPAPTDQRVQIVNLGASEVYVVPFKSLATPFSIRGLLRRSFDYLESEGVKDYDRSMYILAVYDRSPLNLLGRRSELWILRKPPTSPTAPGAAAVTNNMTALARVAKSNTAQPAPAPAAQPAPASGPGPVAKAVPAPNTTATGGP